MARVFALCGVVGNRAMHPSQSWSSRELPNYGPVTARDWRPEPMAGGGFRGLPWGIGDPAVAFLDSDEWAVMRIDDADGGISFSAPSGERAGVKFRTGTVIYKGDPRGAIETLIQLGADAGQMSVRLALPGENGIADVGRYGVAVAGTGGMARGVDFSRTSVTAGYGGVAVSGERGCAKTACVDGLAVVGAGGTAIAGDEALAVGRGEDARIRAGNRAVAAALDHAASLGIASGIAVALGGASRLSGGPDCIVVVREAIPNWTRLRLGSGGIAVFCKKSSSEDEPRFSVTGAGPNGIEPDVWHLWTGDSFRKMDHPRDFAADQAPRGPMETGRPGHADPEVEGRPEPLQLDLAHPLGDDLIVLCDEAGIHGTSIRRDGRFIVASDFDPDPSSPRGIFGLAWGSGNPDLAARCLGRGARWALLRVANAVTVLGAPSDASVVKFERGEVLYQGNPKTALALLYGFGIEPERVVSKLMSVGRGGIVRASGYDLAIAGREGWAISHYYSEAGPGGLAASDGSARVEANGIAITGEGVATAGPRGIAICRAKRHGCATAGDGGVAAGLGMAEGSRYALVKAGRAAAAIFPGLFGVVEAGDEGVAIGGPGSQVRAGRNGVAIAFCEIPKGEPGCLLVCRTRQAFRFAVVDGEGRVPEDFARWADDSKNELRMTTASSS